MVRASGACIFDPQLSLSPKRRHETRGDGKETIRDYVKKIGPTNLPDATRIQATAASFHDGPSDPLLALPSEPLAASGLRTTGAVGNDLVIWDGHHRTCALGSENREE